MSKNQTDKILHILTTNSQIAQLAGYLIRAGAGTILPGDLAGSKKLSTPDEQLIAWELADALATPHEGEWETEIGKLVLTQDVKKMHELAQQLHAKNPCCPYCQWRARVRYKVSVGGYICGHCKRTWSL